MSYDETHNYKITARLKLNSEWFVGKVAVFILVIIIALSISFFYIPGFKDKLYQGYESTLIKVYEKINGLNESIIYKKESILNYINLEGKYREVKEENHSLRLKNSTYEHVMKENQALKKILKYSVNNPKKILSTQILTKSVDGYVEFARIPVGRVNGIKENDTVVDKEKLVGRVVEVHERYSKISLITNPNIILPAIFAETNLKAVLRGRYDGKLVVKILQGDNILPKKDELVLTSGDGYNFPPGIAIGVVSNADLDSIEIEPFFDMKNMYRISILRG
jgi:rod shape-determining protein MreC